VFGRRVLFAVTTVQHGLGYPIPRGRTVVKSAQNSKSNFYFFLKIKNKTQTRLSLNALKNFLALGIFFYYSYLRCRFVVL